MRNFPLILLVQLLLWYNIGTVPIEEAILSDESVVTNLSSSSRQLESECAATDAVKVIIDEPNTACIDGSRPGYYIRKGSDDGLNKWHVHFEGKYCSLATYEVHPMLSSEPRIDLYLYLPSLFFSDERLSLQLHQQTHGIKPVIP
jgi:hypothetical protein